MAVNKPSWRKGAGIVLILLLIVLLAVFVVSLSGVVGRWPVLGQALFYLVVGVIWIVPVKPLLYWMATGRFRVG